MDAISEERLNEVYPELATAIRQMAVMLQQEAISIMVTQGFRSWVEQAALYAQGRTAPGNIVTDAKPGYSWHQFGAAVDVAPFDDGIPDWDIAHPTWGRIVAVGESLGLVAGATFRTFPDWPHFQLSGIPTTPTDDTRNAYFNGGVSAVWATFPVA